MKAFFEKLTENNQESAERFQSMDKSIGDMSEAVQKNTKSESVSTKVLQQLLEITQTRAAEQKTAANTERRESERKSADKSFFGNLLSSKSNNTSGTKGGTEDKEDNEILKKLMDKVGVGGTAVAAGGALAIAGSVLSATKKSIDTAIKGAADAITGRKDPQKLDGQMAAQVDSITSDTINDQERKNITKEEKANNELLLSTLSELSSEIRASRELETERKKLTSSIDELNKKINKGGDTEKLKAQLETQTKQLDITNSNIQKSYQTARDILTDEKRQGGTILRDINNKRREDAENSRSKYTELTPDQITFKRTGGFLPGDGNGDLINAKLEEGEYVLNKNTVKGIGVDNLDRLNYGALPRFQTGGEVTKNSHPKTGGGWQPAGGLDGEGRPIIFSKPAAESFAKMMEVGGVKDSDVASSQRSKSHNSTVGGAGNSAHLYGEAMDIHNSSKQWMITNGEKFGWKRNNYMNDSWHWDYTGKGSGESTVTQEPSVVILAAGTNDFGNPEVAGNDVKSMVETLKSKKYKTSFISPTNSDKYADVSSSTTKAAASAGATTYMPTAWDGDGYHILASEAKNIKNKHPGAIVIGDSNAVRISGGTPTAGKTKLGANTNTIKGFIESLDPGIANEENERSTKPSSTGSSNSNPGIFGGLLSALGSLPGGGTIAKGLKSSMMKGLTMALGTGAAADALGSLIFGGGEDSSDGSGNDTGSNNTVTGSANGNMMEGAQKIIEAGVPAKGAAFLAGNIQQESSWNGQRDWGQVLGDGTSRNGGLVSWASWSDDPARLGKIEKYLGKNISEATDGEQIGAMLWEMKKDYKGAYSTFMNPKSTATELKSASKAYWGYGEEGDRYDYSNQILSQLKESNEGKLGFNKGGLVPSPKDTVSAMLTPGEYVVPQETVNKVGAGYLRGLDNEFKTNFNEANNTKRGQQLSTMVMQPIVINNGGGGGGGGGGMTTSTKSESLPTLPNDSGTNFASDLVMTRHTLSSRIGG